jgi:hypothetical protein
MDGLAFDNAARSAASLARRRSLLFLGGAGLGAARTTSQGVGADKKSKKRCNKEKKQCRKGVQNACAEFGVEEQECLDIILPCCESCKVKAGVSCTIDALASM